jgi:hypothetical protein
VTAALRGALLCRAAPLGVRDAVGDDIGGVGSEGACVASTL